MQKTCGLPRSFGQGEGTRSFQTCVSFTLDASVSTGQNLNVSLFWDKWRSAFSAKQTLSLTSLLV